MPTAARYNFTELRAQMPLAYPGQRIGLMGGTFNPPHAGHAVCAVTALRRLRLDQLWWMVTPGNPLKDQDGLPPLADRLAASQRFASDPRIKVTGFEAALGSPYTYETLRYVTRRFPGVRFVWVMGADNLRSFYRWQSWRRIAHLLPMAVVDRMGSSLYATGGRAAQALGRYRLPERLAGELADRKAPAWLYLHGLKSPLSSTALRALRKGVSKG